MVLRYVGPLNGGAFWDSERSVTVIYVRGYAVRFSYTLALAILATNPTHWVEVKDN